MILGCSNMADPIFIFSRGELVILAIAAILIGVLYGAIDKRRGKFDKPKDTPQDTPQSED